MTCDIVSQICLQPVTMPAVLSTIANSNAAIAATIDPNSCADTTTSLSLQAMTQSSHYPSQPELSQDMEVTPDGCPPADVPLPPPALSQRAKSPVFVDAPPPPVLSPPIVNLPKAQEPPISSPVPPPCVDLCDASHPPNHHGSTTSSPSVPLTLDHVIQEMKAHPKSSTVTFAEKISSNSDSYALRKRKIVCEFLDGLASAAPRYNHMLKKTRNVLAYFPPGEQEVVFVVLCGEDNKRKKC